MLLGKNVELVIEYLGGLLPHLILGILRDQLAVDAGQLEPVKKACSGGAFSGARTCKEIDNEHMGSPSRTVAAYEPSDTAKHRQVRLQPA